MLHYRGEPRNSDLAAERKQQNIVNWGKIKHCNDCVDLIYLLHITMSWRLRTAGGDNLVQNHSILALICNRIPHWEGRRSCWIWNCKWKIGAVWAERVPDFAPTWPCVVRPAGGQKTHFKSAFKVRLGKQTPANI